MRKSRITISIILTLCMFWLSACTIEIAPPSTSYHGGGGGGGTTVQPSASKPSAIPDRRPSDDEEASPTAEETGTDETLVAGGTYNVTGTTFYLALRSSPEYSAGNEIGQIKNGEQVKVYSQSLYGEKSEYCYVLVLSGSAKNKSGYVNREYIVYDNGEGEKDAPTTSSEAESSAPEKSGMSESDIALLKNYAESGEWKNHCEENEGAEVAACNRMEYHIFDLDNNGIPEMLIYADNPERTVPRLLTATSLCVIVDGEVRTLESGSTSEGTIGGTTVSMCMENATGELLICKREHVGGFGGTYNYCVISRFNSNSLTEIMSMKALTYTNPTMGTDEFYVNNEESTLEEVNAKYDEYTFLQASEIPDYIKTYE